MEDGRGNKLSRSSGYPGGYKYKLGGVSSWKTGLVACGAGSGDDSGTLDRSEVRGPSLDPQQIGGKIVA